MHVTSTAFEICVAYVHGRIESEIETFARSLNVPPAELAGRVGALLLTSPGRPQLGAEDRVPELPGPTPARRKRVRKVEVDGGSHRSKTSYEVGAEKQRAYWAKMTRAQRSKEVARRRRLGRSRNQKKAA